MTYVGLLVDNTQYGNSIEKNDSYNHNFATTDVENVDEIIQIEPMIPSKINNYKASREQFI